MKPPPYLTITRAEPTPEDLARNMVRFAVTVAERIHLCPPKGSGLMPCCGRTPFEVPPTDRMTADRTAVTCIEGGRLIPDVAGAS